eukprot:6442635-Prymnesium_polylepis.2
MAEDTAAKQSSLQALEASHAAQSAEVNELEVHGFGERRTRGHAANPRPHSRRARANQRLHGCFRLPRSTRALTRRGLDPFMAGAAG